MNTTELNEKAIDTAVKYLECRGYEILDRSWECKSGCVDIVYRDAKYGAVAFCEVIVCADPSNGFPEERITPQKRNRMECTALAYVAGREMPESAIRFDVISMVVCSENRALIKHHINAYVTDAA